MFNILYLNPTNNQLVVLILFKNKKVFKIVKRYQRPLGETFLKLINELLGKAKIKPTALNAIAVVCGPGSFSSLRVGVVVANTFAWALKIPIISLKADELVNERQLLKIIKKKIKNKRFKPVVPFYDKEPNITWPKA